MRHVLLAVAAVLILGLVVPGSATSAMQGQGKGGGKKPKPTPDTPAIVVFRDATGDLFRSDGLGAGAYVHGAAGIEEASIARDLTLHFPSGKNVAFARNFTLDLAPGARDLTADEITDGPAPDISEMAADVLRVRPVEISGVEAEGGVRAVTTHSFAKVAMFFYVPSPTGKRKPEYWKLSYSDRSLREGDAPVPGEGFARITCRKMDGPDCIAWIVEKVTMKVIDSRGFDEKNRAALVNFGRELDAGEWILPFAIGICIRDSSMVNGKPDLCKSLVGF